MLLGDLLTCRGSGLLGEIVTFSFLSVLENEGVSCKSVLVFSLSGEVSGFCLVVKGFCNSFWLLVWRSDDVGL